MVSDRHVTRILESGEKPIKYYVECTCGYTSNRTCSRTDASKAGRRHRFIAEGLA